MASNNVSTAREALMAEPLQDADALVRRFEQADEALAEKIEKAAADAAGKAFLAFKLNFDSVIDNNADKMTEAGRYACGMHWKSAKWQGRADIGWNRCAAAEAA